MSYIDIYRFSEYGFNSQYQSHIQEYSKRSETLADLISDIDNDHLKTLIKGNTKICDRFEFDGVFVFLNKPSDKDVKYYLNHLDKNNYKKRQKNFYHAKIHKDAICYFDKNFVFDAKNRGTIAEALENGENTLYIPKSSLPMIQDITKKHYNQSSLKKYNN